MKDISLFARLNSCCKMLFGLNPVKLSSSFLLILLISGCKKDDIDPQQAIIGKWEDFYSGNGEYRPPYNSSGYWQFLPDSILLEYDYTTKKTFIYQYWIDTLLNVGIAGKATSYYTPKFYADTMELTVENRTAINYVSKWKRIK